ncbi:MULTISPECIES: RimK family alpha-L-glutamate ligase [Halorhodospira]|uniref:ATP-grasp domain-containing protein n=1 Tax=Halorhodospira TaxID=85108 RepID=UPI001EE8C2C9|nr:MULTISPECIES: hypothetical protein [Halorhodospira]MCG5529235.1 hypothetical protein [Halorhodospira halophila]MCG5544579.1 hypothetical protein [Halorhodospira sp. 9628]
MKIVIGMPPGASRSTQRFLERFRQVAEINKIVTRDVSLAGSKVLSDIRRGDLFVSRWDDRFLDREIMEYFCDAVDGQLSFGVLPPYEDVRRYNNKARVEAVLDRLAIERPRAIVLFDRSAGMGAVDAVGLPCVVKTAWGAGGVGVRLVSTRKEFRKVIRRSFGSGTEDAIRSGVLGLPLSFEDAKVRVVKGFRRILSNMGVRQLGRVPIPPYEPRLPGPLVVQEFIPANLADIRITAIGGRFFAFRRLVRDDGYRASGSGRISYDLDSEVERAIIAAKNIHSALGFECMAYDFLISEGGQPLLIEMNYTFYDRAVYRCPGYWDGSLNWEQGQYWPQALLLRDRLGPGHIKELRV